MFLKKSTENNPTYLELAVVGEDADPLVIIVSDDDVTAGVHSYTRGSLQLSR